VARQIGKTADAITAPVRDITTMTDAALFIAPAAARDVGRISERIEPPRPATMEALAAPLVAEQRARAASGRPLLNREQAWKWARDRWRPPLSWALIRDGQRQAWQVLNKQGRPRNTRTT
jgi:hypothetical protein